MNLTYLLRKSFLTAFLSSLLLLLILPCAFAQNGVDDETCLACHDGVDQTLKFTPHKIMSGSSGVTCAGCHKGAEVHIEDPSTDNIVNPAKVLGSEAQKICFECHVAHVELDNYGFDTHNIEELNCSECHKVHSGKASLLLDDRASFCVPCHQSTMADFTKDSNHPVKQGNLTCLTCHQFKARSGNNQVYDFARLCQECHPAQGGPFMYEHEPVNAYSVEGAGCIECHNPHGSENNHLLRQPVNEMCRSCHAVPGHEIAHGTLWQGYNCATCHTGIHGSFESNQLLDPALPARITGYGNCYQSGCHSLNK